MAKILQVFDGDEGPAEPIIEPEIPIIDAHHHLWPNGSPIADYPIETFLEQDLMTGHNVIATVFAECMAEYHQGGDEALRPVGETEFVVRHCPIESGRPAVAAAIFGFADLRKPFAGRTLDAHIEEGQGRFSGVRHNVYWHPEQGDKITTGPRTFPRHLLLDPDFRAGLKEVEKRGLTYDCYLYSDQLPDLIETADAFPDLPIILCHMGGPVAIDHSPEGRRAVFDRWRVHMAELGKRPNISLKVGGFGMHHYGFPYMDDGRRPAAQKLADLWRDYFDVAFDAFGPMRCMGESNFLPDKNGFSYAAYWNALKLLTKGFSPRERAAIFSETARRVYKISGIDG